MRMVSSQNGLRMGTGFISPATAKPARRFITCQLQEVQQIQAEIESRKYLKYTPVVSFGLRVGF